MYLNVFKLNSKFTFSETKWKATFSKGLSLSTTKILTVP